MPQSIDYGDPYWLDKYYQNKAEEQSEIIKHEFDRVSPQEMERRRKASIEYDNQMCPTCERKNKDCECE